MQPLVGPGGSEFLGAEIALVVGIWFCWRVVRWVNNRVGDRI
ncbi:hypothetical protein [Haladaptatus pallidirubidus]